MVPPSGNVGGDVPPGSDRAPICAPPAPPRHAPELNHLQILARRGNRGLALDLQQLAYSESSRVLTRSWRSARFGVRDSCMQLRSARDCDVLARGPSFAMRAETGGAVRSLRRGPSALEQNDQRRRRARASSWWWGKRHRSGAAASGAGHGRGEECEVRTTNRSSPGGKPSSPGQPIRSRTWAAQRHVRA